MISNQILQTTIDGLKAITRIDMCVGDGSGNILATTFDGVIKKEEDIRSFAVSQADTQLVNGLQYFRIPDEDVTEYILVLDGNNEDAYIIGRMAVFQIQGLMNAYKERFDKENFIKNLLLDNLLLVDIYNRAKKLRVETNVSRVVYIVGSDSSNSTNVLEVITGIYEDRPQDFLTAVDEKNTIIVREVSADASVRELDKVAYDIVSRLRKAGLSDIRVAYGTVVNEIRDVSRSYKEARMAMDVGKIFYEDDPVAAYGKLGIGRLIYQIPLPLCRMFIKETFAGRNPEDFDEETLTTVNKFFENSLNVSETSRQLYIHRNTLVYRIDKLQKFTGLDIRIFDDAITFKIALMVGKYMKYMEKQSY